MIPLIFTDLTDCRESCRYWTSKNICFYIGHWGTLNSVLKFWGLKSLIMDSWNFCPWICFLCSNPFDKIRVCISLLTHASLFPQMTCNASAFYLGVWSSTNMARWILNIFKSIYHKLNQMVFKGDSTACILSDYPMGRWDISLYLLWKLFSRICF